MPCHQEEFFETGTFKQLKRTPQRFNKRGLKDHSAYENLFPNSNGGEDQVSM